MEKEMLAQAQDTKKNRKLKIRCTPTLVWRSTDPLDIGATMAFAVVNDDTRPAMPGAVDPVTGNINIAHMPGNSNYNDNIDITFKLDTSNLKDASGRKLSGKHVARWANSNEGPWSANGQSGLAGFGWFCQISASPPPAYIKYPPITTSQMAFNRADDTHVMIDDDTPDGSPTHAFCMAFVLETYGNYYISIDPILSTKGTNNSSFLLRK